MPATPDSPDAVPAPPRLSPQEFSLFLPLLTALRRRGFAIGVDDCLRLQTLLRRIDPAHLLEGVPDTQRSETLRERYRSLLRPLFAISPEQQIKFDEIFDAFCEQEPGGPLPPPPPDEIEELKQQQADALNDLFAQWNRESEQNRTEAEEKAKKDEIEEQARLKAAAKRRGLRFALFLACLPFLLAGLTAGALWLTRTTYRIEITEPLDFTVAAEKGQPFPAAPPKTVTLHRINTGLLARLSPWQPRLTLSDPSAFSLTSAGGGKEIQTYSIQFRPQNAQNYSAHLEIQKQNIFNKTAAGVPVTGSAIATKPVLPPKVIYRLAGPNPLEFDFLRSGANSPAYELTRDGKPFPPKNLPKITGKDSKAFEVVPEKAANSGANSPEPYRFHVHLKPNQKAGLEAQLVFVSGEKDALDPDPVPVRTKAITPQIKTITLNIQPVPVVGPPRPTRLDSSQVLLRIILSLLFGLLVLRALHFLVIARPERVKRPNPPYELPALAGPSSAPFAGRALSVTANLLAPPMRLDDAVERFDFDATLRATADRAGFPTPIFRSAPASPPAYLVLIERENYRDQQGGHITAMLRALERRGVPAEVFYFPKDPRYCVSRDAATPFALNRLHTLYPRHRLLVFSDGLALTNASGDALTYAARQLDHWNAWALFTTQPLVPSGLRMQTLTHNIPAVRFGIFAATLDGLARYAERFPATEVRTSKNERKHAVTFADTPVPPSLHKFADMEKYASSLERDYFSQDRRLFLWLCACALYPRASYDLTILLGQIVERLRPCVLPSPAASPAPLVTEENLLLMLRLSWFRQGDIPDDLRIMLQTRLANDKDIELECRARLIHLLAAPPLPPDDSVARERVDIERRVQQWLQSQGSHAAELREQIKRVPAYVLYTHPTLVKLIQDERFDLWADVGNWQKRIWNWLYRGGLPRRDHWSPALLWLIALISLGILALGAGTGFSRLPGGKLPGLISNNLNLTPAAASFPFGDSGSSTPKIARIAVQNHYTESVQIEISRTDDPTAQKLIVLQPGAASLPFSQQFEAGQNADISIPFAVSKDAYAKTGGISAKNALAAVVDLKSVFSVTVRRVRDASNPDAIQTADLGINLNEKNPYFDPVNLALNVAANVNSVVGTTILRGQDLPLDAKIMKDRLDISLPADAADTLAFRFKVDTAGTKTERKIHITFAPASTTAQANRVQTATLTYTDAAGFKTKCALTGTVAQKPALIFMPPDAMSFRAYGSPESQERILKRSDGKPFTYHPEFGQIKVSPGTPPQMFRVVYPTNPKILQNVTSVRLTFKFDISHASARQLYKAEKIYTDPQYAAPVVMKLRGRKFENPIFYNHKGNQYITSQDKMFVLYDSRTDEVLATIIYGNNKVPYGPIIFSADNQSFLNYHASSDATRQIIIARWWHMQDATGRKWDGGQDVNIVLNSPGKFTVAFGSNTIDIIQNGKVVAGWDAKTGTVIPDKRLPLHIVSILIAGGTSLPGAKIMYRPKMSSNTQAMPPSNKETALSLVQGQIHTIAIVPVGNYIFYGVSPGGRKGREQEVNVTNETKIEITIPSDSAAGE